MRKAREGGGDSCHGENGGCACAAIGAWRVCVDSCIDVMIMS